MTRPYMLAHGAALMAAETCDARAVATGDIGWDRQAVAWRAIATWVMTVQMEVDEAHRVLVADNEGDDDGEG